RRVAELLRPRRRSPRVALIEPARQVLRERLAAVAEAGVLLVALRPKLRDRVVLRPREDRLTLAVRETESRLPSAVRALPDRALTACSPCHLVPPSARRRVRPRP